MRPDHLGGLLGTGLAGEGLGWGGAGVVLDGVICRLLRQLAQLPQNFVYNFGLDDNVKEFQVI
jgi:hypothetical protein